MIYPDLILPVPGDYQLKNLATYFHAIEILKSFFKIKNDYAKAGIENIVKNTHFMGRWQVLCHKPLTICDVAHNIGAFKYLVSQIEKLNTDKMHIILGFVEDKDIEPILSILPDSPQYYLCKAPVDRALNPKILLDNFSKYHLNAQILDESTFKTYQKVQKLSSPRDLILITGSFFIVGDFLDQYQKNS